MILDDSCLIELIADDDGAVAKLHKIGEQGLTISTLSYTKVSVGLEPNTAEAQQFKSVMDQIALVPYEAEATRRAVDIQRRLRSQGKPIGAVDVMIAGIALFRDEPVVKSPGHPSEHLRTKDPLRSSLADTSIVLNTESLFSRYLVSFLSIYPKHDRSFQNKSLNEVTVCQT